MHWRHRAGWGVFSFGLALGLVGCGLVLGVSPYRACEGAECGDAAADADGAAEASDAADAREAAPTCNPEAGPAAFDQDPVNCGACGHSCLGAACSKGKCVPTTLVAGVSGVGARAMVVDDTDLYFVSNYHIMFCPLTGCGETATVLTGRPGATLSSLTHSGNQLFFTAWWYADGGTTGDLESALKGAVGGNPSVIAASPTQPTAAKICSQSICWVDSSGSQSSVYYSPATPATATTVAQLAGPLNGILAWDGTNVYFADGQTIYSAPLSGGPPKTVAQRYNVTDLVYSKGQLYWFEQGLGQTAVATCALPNCAATVNVLVSPARGSVASIALDDQYVYWTDMASPGGGVLRCGRTGCKNVPDVLVDFQPQPTAIAVDAARIYWINGQATVNASNIMWVAK